MTLREGRLLAFIHAHAVAPEARSASMFLQGWARSSGVIRARPGVNLTTHTVPVATVRPSRVP
jgi:hypothetical protein